MRTYSAQRSRSDRFFQPRIFGFALLLTGALPVIAQHPTRATRRAHSPGPKSLTLYGDDGKPRIRLDASGATPSIILLQRDGTPALQLQLDSTDHPMIHLQDAHNLVNTTLQIDEKGTHLMMNGPNKSRSYMFITDANVSGIVMQDQAGVRRFDLIRSAEGSVTTHEYDAAGKANNGETHQQATPTPGK